MGLCPSRWAANTYFPLGLAAIRDELMKLGDIVLECLAASGGGKSEEEQLAEWAKEECGEWDVWF